MGCFAEVSNQMLELYEQNKSSGPTGSLANDPSPSEMNRGLSQYEGPSANGHHHQQNHLVRAEGAGSESGGRFQSAG